MNVLIFERVVLGVCGPSVGDDANGGRDVILCGVGVAWRTARGRRAVDLGGGFDFEQPVRPWPTWRDNVLPRSKARRLCVCWFGMFVGWTR